MPDPASPKTCRCGHDRTDPMVTAETEYGLLGYVRLMIGGTPTPTRVRFRCRDCNQVIEDSVDLDVRRANL